MTRTLKTILWTLPAATLGLAQSSTPDATIQALLAEVRQLRMALERSAVLAPKIQLTLQRLQIQQDQVARTSKDLETLRDQMSKATTREASIAQSFKQEEERIQQELDPQRRKAMEQELRMNKTRLEEEREQQAVLSTQQRARESELASRLRLEQAKLDELSTKLDNLERSLDPPAQK